MPKQLALFTMVYDDDVFLDIFLRYWAQFLPLKNIYVLIHADYEKYEALAAGCNCIRINRPEMHKDSEVDRWKMISHFASGMSFMFDRVIYTDVDEIIVVDPDIAPDPVQYLLDQRYPVIAAPGVDLVNIEALEPQPYDPAKPVLSQRRHYALNSWYTKPCITTKPIQWCSGGHFSDIEKVHVDPNLTLVHLRLFDARIFEDRSAARIKMISDKETGEPISGLGGKTWRRTTDQFERYFTDDIQQTDKIFAFGHEKKSHEVRGTRDGYVLRNPKEKRTIQRIPARYETLF
ncbi:hypothetical protein IV417_01170 [Alphaproteobacteria bacterium KMM 3653]|uniref:Glycosyl transferase family 2 n=1 Tax=Harenicola maris TaxID=2841044 RepID=A0AAP2CQS8_9RHOB|nr:hypothetical protein [Harenicola maris]